jgi:hypothetical protein
MARIKDRPEIYRPDHQGDQNFQEYRECQRAPDERV